MVFQDGVHYVGIDDERAADFDAVHFAFGRSATRGLPCDARATSAHARARVGTRAGARLTARRDIAAFRRRRLTDADGWGISGHSSGGIAAFMIGWYRPEKFHKLLTHDASFPNTGDNMGVSLLASVDASAMKPLRVYLMSGPMDLGGWYTANTNAATKLAAKGYHYQFKTENNGHYPPKAGVADFSNALRWMWRGYKL